MSRLSRLRLVLAGLAALALAWVAVLYVTGGLSFTIFALRLSTRDPLRPLVLALVCGGGYVLLSGAAGVRADAEQLEKALRPAAMSVAVALGLAVLAFGVRYGTFSAGGADSYGYVSQAELWEKGRLDQPQPLAAVVPWPDAIRTLSPLGYTPGPHGDDIVPIYSPGLPLLMAAFRRLLGGYGQYYVVPVLGALAVWLTFVLGRWLTGSSSIGLAAACVFAFSRPFLAALLWPMTDVPVTAAWTLAFLLALHRSPWANAASGIAASAAVVIRPNLAPVAVIIALGILWRSFSEHGRSRRALVAPLAFAAGLIPGVGFVAAVNADLYGSPLRSGYNTVHALYTPAYIAVNAPRYARWIVASGCTYIFLGVAAIFLYWPRTIRVPHRGSSRFLVAGAVFVIWLSYMFWVPFQESEWWFLRFLLPLWPISIVCAAALAAEALGRVRLPAASAALLGLAVVISLVAYRSTIDSRVFRPREGEARYERAAASVSGNTPPTAVIFAMQHSGSVRYYANRVTVRYDFLDPAWLDRGVAALSKLGYRSFFLLDDWEESQFRQRFGGNNELGRLDWAAEMVAPGVYLYDATGRLTGSR